MRVAVLMSAYNGEKHITEQIDSILAQEGNFQIDLCVRDDGSTDETKNILRKYEEKGKLQWYTGDNLGPARSFIDLVKHCKEYDYYVFADQDDYWFPEKIQAAVELLKKQNGPILYFANAELVDSDLNFLGRNVYKIDPKLDFETLSCAGGILGCTIVFNSTLANAIQEKPSPEKMVMHDFYVGELCLALGGQIIFDSMAYMKYRQHGSNVVGVPSDIFGAIKNRLSSITQKMKVSIAEQANELLKLYDGDITADKKTWLKKIACYKGNIISRISLAASRKTKYINLNMSIKLRLSILFGNR